MYCKFCGKSIPENTIFCSYCGGMPSEVTTQVPKQRKPIKKLWNWLFSPSERIIGKKVATEGNKAYDNKSAENPKQGKPNDKLIRIVVASVVVLMAISVIAVIITNSKSISSISDTYDSSPDTNNYAGLSSSSPDTNNYAGVSSSSPSTNNYAGLSSSSPNINSASSSFNSSPGKYIDAKALDLSPWEAASKLVLNNRVDHHVAWDSGPSDYDLKLLNCKMIRFLFMIQPKE
jgi:hypothetical protein